MAGQGCYCPRVFKTSGERQKSRQMARVDWLFGETSQEIINYNHRSRMGKTIGSGRVEKGVDLIVGQRQKNKGMSWRPLGSKALCLLKVAEFNGQWQQLWLPPQAA